MTELKIFSTCLVICLLSATSCVTSHVFEEAQTVGPYNKSISGSLARGLYKPEPMIIDRVSDLYLDNDIGTARVHATYGVSEYGEVGIGLDFPVGLRMHFKQQIPVGNVHHEHALKVDLFVPVIYYLQRVSEQPLVGVAPTYIYTYRYDDLLSFSANASVQAFQTRQRTFGIPGISAGMHVGDELKFTAGLSYYNNFGYLGSSPIQFLTVEAGIKLDIFAKPL